MTPVQQLDHVVPALIQLVDELQPEDLGRPTPCARFTVQDVLEHMIGGGTTFAAMYRGEQPGPAPVGTPGTVPAREFSAALSALVAAMKAPGAMERTLATPAGELTGETFGRFVALDGLTHGWDLARATGKPWNPPVEIVDEAAGFAQQAIAPMRDGDTFKDPTTAPAGASALDQLMAFTGRTV